MTCEKGVNDEKRLFESLKIDCEKCFGFCCVALFFSASDGFPINKDAGKPCINLKANFSCSVHKELREKGLKGCTAYDCFGAGQKVAQVTYQGKDWRQVPESSKMMFEVFLIMRQLHEMLWYLTDAHRLQANSSIHEKLAEMINKTEHLTHLDADSIIALDIETHRNSVNALLQQTSEMARAKASKGQKISLKVKKSIAGRANFIGTDLKKSNLRGADLRGAFLIAADLSGADLSGADLIGADMRDTDLRGANLTESIFLSQGQINAAKGDSNTKLPRSLTRPKHWGK